MTTRRLRWLLAGVIVACLLAGLLSIPQVRSYVRHLGGSPTETWPIEPYPQGDSPDLRLAVAGDVGYPGSRVEATARAIEEAADLAGRDFDALVLLGDNVYPDGDPARLDETVFAPFGALLGGAVELLPILGNHDVTDGNAAGQVERLEMPGRWYAKTFDDVLFVGLDSNDLSDEQLTWLDDTLAATTARWRIVALHHPPYSSGYQGSSLEVRRVVSPIVERHGVQLVLSGHEHDYERTRSVNGVVYIVSGGAADTRRTGREEFTAAAWSWHHFLDVSVHADRLQVRAVNQDARIFDEVEIAP